MTHAERAEIAARIDARENLEAVATVLALAPRLGKVGRVFDAWLTLGQGDDDARREWAAIVDEFEDTASADEVKLLVSMTDEVAQFARRQALKSRTERGQTNDELVAKASRVRRTFDAARWRRARARATSLTKRSGTLRTIRSRPRRRRSSSRRRGSPGRPGRPGDEPPDLDAGAAA